MRVKTLRMQGFRGIQETVSLDFGHSNVNVVFAENGTGKSTVLDCLAILLSRLLVRILNSRGTGRQFTENDINVTADETVNEISVIWEEQDVSWQVSKTRKGRKRQSITNLKRIKHIADALHERLGVDPKANVPIAVYYGVNRAVLDIPLRIRTKHEWDQMSAFDQALWGGRNDFRLFFEWFRDQEEYEMERRLSSADHLHYSDPQLDAVRKVIGNFLGEFSDLKVLRRPLRMVVTKRGAELRVDQLSDGEKCLMAMVADLARRLAVANPRLADPLEGRGVVLIDEIDLHLHPNLQRSVIRNLKTSFPNCQFILTTHSPQVLSMVRRKDIYQLEWDERGIVAFRPESRSYGRDTNQILDEIMDVRECPPEIHEKLREYFRLIARRQLEAAQDLRRELEDLLGSDHPKFARADAMLSRMESAGS